MDKPSCPTCGEPVEQTVGYRDGTVVLKAEPCGHTLAEDEFAEVMEDGQE